MQCAEAAACIVNMKGRLGHCKIGIESVRQDISQRMQFHMITHVVGSSRNIMGGLLTSSKAMESRFCSPPDNRWPIVSAVLVSRKRSSISSI